MSKILCVVLFLYSFAVGYGQSYYVSTNNGQIILADYQNCTYQIICDTISASGMNTLGMFDIAMTPNRNLYATDGKKIHKIDLQTCTYTPVTPLPITDTLTTSGTWLNSLVALNDTFLLGASNGAAFFKINVMTGVSYFIDSLYLENNGMVTYFPSVGDLTWYKNKLLLVAGISDLVEIVPNATYTEVLDIRYIGTMETTNDAIYGVITIGHADCTDDSLTIVGFEDYDVYKVNPRDASLQKICADLFPGNVFGATSITETQYQDYTSRLEIPNIFTPNGDQVNDSFRPIEETNITHIDICIYNRWGSPVYKETGTTFNWDGRFGNSACVDGVYYYIIRYETLCGPAELKNGFLTLNK